MSLEKIIEENEKNIKHYVRKYSPHGKRRGMDIKDLYQEAIIGLIKAVKDYKPEKNTKLSTFISLYIEHRLYALCTSKHEELSEEEYIKSLITDTHPSPEETFLFEENKLETKTLIYKCLNSLSEREQYIVRSRHLSDPPLTLETLAKTLSISKERVRQIEETCLQKMKKAYIYLKSTTKQKEEQCAQKIQTEKRKLS